MKWTRRSPIAAAGFGLVVAVSTHATAQQEKGGEGQRADSSESGSQKAKGQNPQGASAESAKAKSSDKQSAKATEPVVLAVTTIAVAESTGCWAKIHDGEGYTGRTLTLMGKQSLPHLEFGIGSDWEGDIDSVEVGPNATLTMYDDENYADDARELTPNTRVPDLHQALFDEGIESLKLTCSNGATR